MFHLVSSWQHMAAFQSSTTRTYQDRTCSRVCPTYSLGSQGCAALAHFEWLPATTAMKVGQTWKKNNVVNKDVSRSSKMFQDVSTVTKRCLNFRSSFSEFQTKSPARLSWPHQEMEKSMGNEDRCHRSLSHMAVDLLATTDIPWIYTKCHFLWLPKKNDWPLGKHGLENPPFSLIFPLKTFIWWDAPAHHWFPHFAHFFSLWGHDRSVSFGEALWSRGSLPRLSGFTVSPKKHPNQRTPMKHVKHCEAVHKSSTIQLCMEIGDTFKIAMYEGNKHY